MLQIPEKKFLVLIFLLSLLNPLVYVTLVHFPSQGLKFLGFFDDGLMLSLMHSPARNFESPWALEGEGNVFHNPLVGSIYLFIILGLIPVILGIPIYAAFIFYKFLFAVLYYLVAYNFICYFVDRKNRGVAFLFFMLAAGIGGILYTAFSLFQSQYAPLVGFVFTAEFEELGGVAHSLTHLPRLYYLVPEILAYLSLLMFAAGRKILSGVFLGLSGLFYPMSAVVTAVMLLLFYLAYNPGSYRKKMYPALSSLAPVALVAALFFIPWIIAYFQKPFYFNIVRTESFDYYALVKIMGSFALTLPLAVLFLRRNIPLLRKTVFVVPALAVMILFALQQLYPFTLGSSLFRNFASNLGLINILSYLFSHSLLIELAAAGMAVVIIHAVFRSNIRPEAKFFAAMLVAFTVLSGIQPAHIGLFTARFGSLMLITFSILAAYGLSLLDKKKIVVAVILLLSLSSLIGFNLRIIKQANEEATNVYVSESDYNALLWLETQPQGRVLSGYKISLFAPLYAGKRALLFSGRINERENDYRFFFLNATEGQKIALIQKYNISYVFYGEPERKINPAFSFGGEVIYNNGTVIYKVKD